MIIRFLFLALILPCFHLLAASPEVFDLHRATEQDTATTFSLIGRDDDGDELTYSIVTEPSHGSVSINGNQVTYTPKANSNYTETFTYKATDGVSNSEVGIINMAVFTGYRDIAQQLGQDIDGEAKYNYSGWSVSTSADGRTVAIGAIYNDGNGSFSGHVRIYTFNSGEWRRLGQDIDGEAAGDQIGEAAGDQSGYSVSTSADGRTVAIGAIYNDGNGINSGHVRIYNLNTSIIGSSWTGRRYMAATRSRY